MKFFDIHTHRSSLCAHQAILSCHVGEVLPSVGSSLISVGIHPWHLTTDNATSLSETLSKSLDHPSVIALGEAGLDKLACAPLDLQTAVFNYEIHLSEERQLPLVIHCVRAFNELLQLKKEVRPSQPWVIHGFRGKASMAEMCCRSGCYLSFGAKFQEAAVRAIPLERLLIETDESVEPVEEIYYRIARLRGISLQELTESVWKNVCEVFFNK